MQTKEQRRQSTRPIVDINVAGLSAIMVVLLFIFIGSIETGPDLPVIPSVDLAKVDHPVPMPGAKRDDAIIISVRRNGTIYFRGDRILIEQLAVRIQDGLKQGAPRKIFIQADARARYRGVRDVLARVRSAGIENVSFLVEQRPHASSSR